MQLKAKLQLVNNFLHRNELPLDHHTNVDEKDDDNAGPPAPPRWRRRLNLEDDDGEQAEGDRMMIVNRKTSMVQLSSRALFNFANLHHSNDGDSSSSCGASDIYLSDYDQFSVAAASNLDIFGCCDSRYQLRSYDDFAAVEGIVAAASAPASKLQLQRLEPAKVAELNIERYFNNTNGAAAAAAASSQLELFRRHNQYESLHDIYLEEEERYFPDMFETIHGILLDQPSNLQQPPLPPSSLLPATTIHNKNKAAKSRLSSLPPNNVVVEKKSVAAAAAAAAAGNNKKSSTLKIRDETRLEQEGVISAKNQHGTPHDCASKSHGYVPKLRDCTPKLHGFVPEKVMVMHHGGGRPNDDKKLHDNANDYFAPKLQQYAFLAHFLGGGAAAAAAAAAADNHKTDCGALETTTVSTTTARDNKDSSETAVVAAGRREVPTTTVNQRESSRNGTNGKQSRNKSSSKKKVKRTVSEMRRASF